MKIWGYNNNLDLLLINSPLSDYGKLHPEYTVFQPPIGLAALASYLDRRGFRIGVWDADADKVSPKEIVEEIVELKPRWVGFNTFTSGFEILGDIVSRIRQVSPDTKLMLGGIHATVAGEDFLDLDHFRNAIVVRNDGEFKTEALLKGCEPQIIPGVEFVNQGSLVVNEENPRWLVQDVDHPLFALDRRFVPYDPTLDNISPDGKKRAFIASSRGCPYECKFCSSSRLARENRAVRFRSPSNVIEEITEIVDSGVLDIKFNDELVWVSEGRIKAILGGLVELGYKRETGLQIRGNGRANIIADCSEETLDLMVTAGVRKVGFGVELGTKEGMAILKKHLTPVEVITATARLAERGIPALANFMFNIPGEDEKEARATVALAKELVLIGRKYGVPVELDSYPYRPYPGTEYWDELIKEGYRKEDLMKVIQVGGETGGGSHLQVEPYVHLSSIDLTIERMHRRVLDNLTKMTDEQLALLEEEYPIDICLEGERSVTKERER